MCIVRHPSNRNLTEEILRQLQDLGKWKDYTVEITLKKKFNSKLVFYRLRKSRMTDETFVCLFSVLSSFLTVDIVFLVSKGPFRVEYRVPVLVDRSREDRH